MRCVWRESLQPATARLGPGVLAPNARRLQAGQPGAYLGRRLGAAALLEVRQGSHTGAQVALRTKQAERGQAARSSAWCLWQGGARMQVSASPNAGGLPCSRRGVCTHRWGPPLDCPRLTAGALGAAAGARGPGDGVRSSPASGAACGVSGKKRLGGGGRMGGGVPDPRPVRAAAWKSNAGCPLAVAAGAPVAGAAAAT